MGYLHPLLSKIEDTWYKVTAGSCTFTMYHSSSHWIFFLYSFDIFCSFSSVRIMRFWLRIKIDCEKRSRAPWVDLLGLFDWFGSSLSSISSSVSSSISSSLGAMESELNWSCNKHSDLLIKWSFGLCSLLYSLVSMPLFIWYPTLVIIFYSSTKGDFGEM